MVLAAALWATVGVADAAMSGPDLPAILSGFIRTALGALFLGLAAVVLRLPMRIPASRSGAFPWLAVLAFGLCCALFQITLFASFRHAGISTTVAVTVCLPPLLLALGETLLNRRPPCFPLTLSLGLAVMGVVLLQLRGARNGPTELDIPAIALLLSASLAFCGLTLATRHITRHVHGLWAAAAGLSATAVTLLGVALVTTPNGLAVLPDLVSRDALLLLYVGVMATGLAYFAFTCGLARARSASVALVATMTEPVFAALLAGLLIGERLDLWQITGIVALLCAMVVLYRGTR